MKKYFLLFFLLSLAMIAHPQKRSADSLRQLLNIEKTDTGRVRLTWQLARDISSYNPDSAIIKAQEALQLARKIGYTEGQSRSLGILSNALAKIGNYPRALELNIEKLKLEEKRNNPRNLASVLMNIGIIYVYQEEYRKGLEYYTKADSIIEKFNVEDFRFNILLNLGDVYNRLDISDSAYVHFNSSLQIARKAGDPNNSGLAFTGLGHSYRKLGSWQFSLQNYHAAIANLKMANNDEVLCEAMLGLAKLFIRMNQADSAIYFARLSRVTAERGDFLGQELEAARFLKDLFEKKGRIDSAYTYLSLEQQINNSINSREKVRELQIISSNEQFRQMELEQARKAARKERYQQLQLLMIGIFIPGLFLVTLLLNRVKIHVTAIRLLGVLSLLFFFEYLTLLLHPTVARLTHHTPLLEILIFVVIAAILIPAHHKIEHLLVHKLLHHRIQAKKTETTKNEEVKKSTA